MTSLSNIPFVWWKGKCVPEVEAFVPVTNRGFLFADGIFRTLKVLEGTVELYTIHLTRLYEDCKALHLQIPEIHPSWIKEIIHANQAHRGAWRLKWIISRNRDGDSELLITLEPYNKDFPNPCRLGVYPYPIQGPYQRIKTLAYAERLSVSSYAQDAGYDDALVLLQNGIITDTSSANVFWQKGSDFFFPDPKLSFLEGTTVSTIQKLCEKQGWKTRFVQLGIAEIPEDACVYCCNSMRGIVPVASILDKHFQRNESSNAKLLQSYKEFVEPFHFK